MDFSIPRLLSLCILSSAKTKNTWCISCERDMLCSFQKCPVCARPAATERVCGSCLKNKPDYSRTEVLFQYRYPIKQLIKTFKFNNRPELSIAFADLMTKKLSHLDTLPNKLIPVPLYKRRQRQRGYNQSIVFAEQIAKRTGIKTDLALCQRIKHTKPQSTLSINDRKKNVRGAFKLSDTVVPRHVAIVDDVITSGSTINEIARLLKKAGCEKIDVWAIARA